MNNVILIAQNNGVDMFDNEVQVFDTELPELPETMPTETFPVREVNTKPQMTEKDAFIGKSLQVCLWLVICIAIILLAAFIYKKIREGIAASPVKYKKTENVESEEQPEYIQSPVRKSKFSKLNTPINIHQCIVSFLEITKEN
ncbi:hypothetical protein IJ182_03385 [bacterium]|nr:hypothetical protein [bacterium]